MLQENELVPFEAKPLLGERLLVLAPHPDDEALGCGGLVALHANAGKQVLVVVATDGTAAGPSADANTARALRENETSLGLARLGVSRPAEFLGLPDRLLASNLDSLRASLREILLREKPDLVAAPSPVELHPDHVALARALFDLLHGDAALRSALPPGNVAFYEVGQPLQPNALVDITSVSEAKDAAIACHASQTGLRDYGRFIRGLNEFRTMTLGAEARVAEAYAVASFDELRTMPWSELCKFVLPRWQERLEPEAAHERRARAADPATLQTEAARLSERLRKADEELQRLNGECISHRALLEEHKLAADKQTAVIGDLFREIERLNGIINAVHRSRLWKLRESLGRLTGRG